MKIEIATKWEADVLFEALNRAIRYYRDFNETKDHYEYLLEIRNQINDSYSSLPNASEINNK